MPDSILIIEDDEDIRELIRFNLSREGHRVLSAEDGESGYVKAINNQPGIILLDLMLPKMNGIKVCELLRKNPKTVSIPIIMITAKASDSDIVKGLSCGADDYITKPFSLSVLLARIKAIQRRKTDESQKDDVIIYHDITIDPSHRKVIQNGFPLEMTFSEFQILWLLAKNPGRVYTRSQIVDTVHGSNHAIADRSVDVQIVAIRKKLTDHGQYIETVRGVGYRLQE